MRSERTADPRLRAAGGRLLDVLLVVNMALAGWNLAGAWGVLRRPAPAAPLAATRSPAPTPGGPATVGLSPLPPALPPVHLGTSDLSVLSPLPLEEDYWAVTRFEEDLDQPIPESVFQRIEQILQEGAARGWPARRERTALLQAFTPGMARAYAIWQLRSTQWPKAAQLSMYATRDDALDCLRDPDRPTRSSNDPNDQPPLAVPYYSLLWGVMELEQHSNLPPSPAQARFVAGVVQEMLGIFQRLQAVYASAVVVAQRVLTPEQTAYIQTHMIPIEQYSLRFRDLVPVDADVVGYVALHLLARRAGVSFRKVPAPVLLDLPVNPTPVAGTRPDPEYYFSGVLMLEDAPRLAVTAEQARALMPYVKGVADANYHSHMVKEQIGAHLTQVQRIWILQRLAQLQAQHLQPPFPSPGEVVEVMLKKASQAPAR